VPKERQCSPVPFWKREGNSGRWGAEEIWYVEHAEVRVVPSPERGVGGGFFSSATAFSAARGCLALRCLQTAPQSCRPSSQPPAPGISRRDGYGRGSSRTSFSQPRPPARGPSLPLCPPRGPQPQGSVRAGGAGGQRHPQPLPSAAAVALLAAARVARWDSGRWPRR